MRALNHWVLAFAFIAVAINLGAQPKPESPAGRRFKITDGQLFIPADYHPAADAIDLTIHLHGTPTVTEPNLARAKYPGVLVSVVLPGLSGVYTKRFSETNAFQRILDETAAQLKMLKLADNPRFRHVTLSSFSAGFGGVREILKDGQAFQRVDALIMADSIYAGYIGEIKDHQVNPANMEGFLKFAREAAAGKKWFILSHTQQVPEGYASTTETANYLLTQLDARREQAEEDWAGDLKLLTRFRRGHLEIYGFAGDTPNDHMKHLRSLANLLERVRW